MWYTICQISIQTGELSKMVYTCKKCKFMFDRVGLVERCPDCGSENFRPASKEEKAEFEGYQKEFNKKSENRTA